jgi:predicted phosphodiesterase
VVMSGPGTRRGRTGYSERMRVAIVSDVHGNLGALEAVVEDIRRSAPDLVVQGGDVALIGPRPAEVVDRVRDLGWPGVAGNCDDLLWNPGVREEQERRAPNLRAWLGMLFGCFAPWALERLGEARLAWLRGQPRMRREAGVSLTHASPGDLWRAPMPSAGDAELVDMYGAGSPLAVYGHIHRPFVRALPGLTVANCGSAGLPWDGDWRPSYLLVDDGVASVRRVEYDVDEAVRDLRLSAFPRAAWLESVWRSGRFLRTE